MTTPLPRVRGVMVVAVACATAACAAAGIRVGTSAPPPAPVAEERGPIGLEGEWTLMSLRLADGATRRVSGFLRYDRFSTLVVLAELSADEPTLRPPRAVLASFTAKATLVADRFEFTALQDSAPPDRLTPDAVPMAEWRYVDIEGDLLRLSARDRNGRPAATLTFQRAR